METVIAFLVLVIVVYTTYLAINKKIEITLVKEDFIKYTYTAIIWAEENIVGTKLGQERLAYVCGLIAKKIPKYLSIFITKDTLEEFVETIFDFAKEEFDKLEVK